MVKRLLICFAYVCCVACGSSSNPITPSPGPNPTPISWTFSGRVVNQNSQGIPAHLSPYNVNSGNDGSFTATGNGSRTSDRVTIDADGYVSRQTTISSSNTAPTLDLFPASALDFYRQMARNGFEAPNSLQSIRRWTSPPQFYISQDGQLSPEDIRRIDVGILAATNQLTPFGNVGITVGPSRADQVGWVTISFVNSFSAGYCGNSQTGVTQGHIIFNLAPYGTTAGGCAGFCPGAQMIPGTVAHEAGHALGFWHTSEGTMKAGVIPSRCTEPIVFTPAERQAAAIAYARPNGNSDPDVDPAGLAF